jgi:hypothetical protein
MNKYFKIFLISLLTLAGLAFIGFILIYQNIDKLKKYALDELNQQLKTPITTSEIQVSIFSTFPMVSLELKDISMDDPLRAKHKLIQAQRLYLGFNILDVINNNYQVQLIQLDSGSINLYIDKKGKQNFDVLKSSGSQTSSKSSNAFSFQLNKVGLNRMRIQYKDIQASSDLDVYASEAHIAGKFNEKAFQMNLKLSGLCQHMQFGTLSMFKDKNLNLNLAFQVDNQKNLYTIQTGDFAINTLFLHLSGDMEFQPRTSKYNLNFSADKITIQDLISVLPVTLPSSINEYASQGKVFFKGSYKGKQTSKESPQLLVDFGIEEGSLTDPKSGLKITDINLKGQYNGSSQLENATLNISDLTAKLPGSNIKGNLALNNLIKPQLLAELTGIADLQELNNFFKFEDVKAISGNLNFTTTIKGSKVDSNWVWDSNFSKGLFKLSIPNLSLDYLAKPFENIELASTLNGNSLSLESLNFKIGQSDFSINGSFPDFLGLLENQSKTFVGNLSLNSKQLSLEDLLVYDANDPKEAGDEAFDFRLTLNVDAKKFTGDKFLANNLTCKAILLPNRTELPYFSLQTCSGSFAGEASWQMQENGYVLKANHQATHIDLTQLLQSFDNFGQTEITYKHLKGFLSAQTDMIVSFDKKMNVNLEKLLLVSSMNIKNGELIDYKPLLGLSKFAEVEELKHIKFSDLQNTLTIRNNQISIPEMQVKSNAFNLGLSGKHTFENVVDYKIKLALYQLIRKKRKVQPNEFGEEDPVSKNWTIYLNIHGPISDLKYSFDRKGASQQLKEEVKKEGENIKEILKQEFQVKKDTSLRKVETQNNNPNELEFEEE